MNTQSQNLTVLVSIHRENYHVWSVPSTSRDRVSSGNATHEGTLVRSSLESHRPNENTARDILTYATITKTNVNLFTKYIMYFKLNAY